jgi:septum site-determining protein MinC
MNEQLLKETAFKLKGRLYTFMVMQLLDPQLPVLTQQLQQAIQQAPKLFQGLAVILDCSLLGDQPVDLQALCHCLREHEIFPVAVQGVTPLLGTVAQCLGLAVMHASNTQDKGVPPEEKEIKPVEAPKPRQPVTQYHAGVIRSGQQVVAREGDLLVMGSVSAGAEVLAAGNIYIYGALRGRALAGISGEKTAHILCQSLEAELLAITSVYRLNEDMTPIQQPCHIYLTDGKIMTDRVGTV